MQAALVALGTVLVLLLVVAMLAAAAWLGFKRGAPPRRSRASEAVEESWRPVVAALEVKLDGVRRQVAEEAERAEKAAERARYYARKSAEARDGRDDEDEDDQDVSDDDARGGGAQGVLPLRPRMEDGPQPELTPDEIALRNARAIGYPFI